MARRVKIGDIIEITTGGGFAYTQYTHKDAARGALLRVFNGIYVERISDINLFYRLGVRFKIFFPLHESINRGIFKVIGNIDIPPDRIIFPTFRNGVRNPSTGKVDTWFIWNGKEEWPVEKLSAEQRKYSLEWIVNDTRLVELIETGWRPEDFV
jgi:hypothetical protein